MTEAVQRSSTINFGVIDAALRTQVEFISVRKMYSKPFLMNEGDELLDAYPAFTIWEAYVDEKQPPLLIYDDKGDFKPRSSSYSLSLLDFSVVDFLELLPAKTKKQVEDIQERYGYVPGDEQHWDIFYHQTPALKHKDAVEKVASSWGAFIGELVDFKGPAVDPRLRTIRLCHLNGGYDQTINGHAIVCLPGNTMKSTLYDMLGPKDEKISANTTVGYSDTEGPHMGSVHGTDHTFTVDQFESQGGWQVFRYLQSLMESGKARVDTAAQPFVVKSSATFVILANPGRSDPSKSFMWLLEHMVKEPSFGRRFGIILYDTKAQTAGSKLTRQDEARWKRLVEFYRAVEEAAAPNIRKIYEDQDVWNWLNYKPYSWVSHVLDLIAHLDDESTEGMKGLHDFLQQFVENGMTHTRGAALSAAIASNLDRILLGKIPREELLSQAEEFLSQLLDINESSIRMIAQNFQEERKSSIKAWFDGRPSYLKEIIRAVLTLMEAKKEANAASGEILKVDLGDVAGYTADGQYFSTIIDRARKANPESHNGELKHRLGFELIQEGKDLQVAIHTYHVFDNFDIFDIVGRTPGLNERLVSSEEEGKVGLGVVGQDGRVTAPSELRPSTERKVGGSQTLEPENAPPNEASSAVQPQRSGIVPEHAVASPSPRPDSDISDISGKPTAHLVIKKCSEPGCDKDQVYTLDKRPFCREHFLAKAKERKEATT